jgi:hypothetical protein
VAHGEALWDGVEVLRAWVVVVLERISRLGFWEREANVRRVWRVAHRLQMLGSARRRLLAIEAAIVGVWLWCCNGGFGVYQKLDGTEVRRSLLTSSNHLRSPPRHIRVLPMEHINRSRAK